MSFTYRRRRGELEPLVSVVDNAAKTADMADGLETSVPLRRPYMNNDRFRPSYQSSSFLGRTEADMTCRVVVRWDRYQQDVQLPIMGGTWRGRAPSAFLE